MSSNSGWSGRLCTEAAAEANSTFLSNLERWIEATVECNMEKNSSPDQMAKKVMDSYVRNIESNIEYHEVLASIYDQAEDRKSPFYLRHKLMADIYRNMLKPRT